MNIVPDIIKPIRLARGPNKNIGATGVGCFMNVVAFLNGDAVITDNSPCVCPSVRRVAIFLNDHSTNNQRNQLLPFVLRALGSATKDSNVFEKRVGLLDVFNDSLTNVLKTYSAEFYKISPYNDAFCINEVSWINMPLRKAYYYADVQEERANFGSLINSREALNSQIGLARKMKSEIFRLGLEFLDKTLPPAESPDSAILHRAQTLCDLSA